MKKLSAALLSAIVLLLLAIIPASADTQYMYNYDPAHSLVVTTNGANNMLGDYLPSSSILVVDRFVGHWHYICNICGCTDESGHHGTSDCTGKAIACTSGFCAAGRFVYTRNTNIITTPGSNLDFSSGMIEPYDTTPITSFTMSSIVFFAGISGFLEQSLIHNGLIAILVIMIFPRLARRALAIFNARFDDDTDNEDKSPSVKDGPTKPKGTSFAQAAPNSEDGHE